MLLSLFNIDSDHMFNPLNIIHIPDNKIHGANMGPTWVLSASDGPHVGHMNLAIRDCFCLQMLESKWVSSSKDVIVFRKALLNPVTSLQFRRYVSIKGDNYENDVLFWQEIQRYKVNTDAHKLWYRFHCVWHVYDGEMWFLLTKGQKCRAFLCFPCCYPFTNCWTNS